MTRMLRHLLAIALLASTVAVGSAAVEEPPVAEATLYNCSTGKASNGDYGYSYCANWSRGGALYHRSKVWFKKWTWSCYCWKFTVRYGPWKRAGSTSYAWGPSGWNATDVYIQFS